jgi:hypothetical protein
MTTQQACKPHAADHPLPSAEAIYAARREATRKSAERVANRDESERLNLQLVKGARR